MEAANTAFRQLPGKQDQGRDARVKDFVYACQIEHTVPDALARGFADGDELKDAA